MASTVTGLMRRRLMMADSLPYDAEIEYLESTNGLPYINTGIVPDANTGAKLTLYGTASDNYVFGLRDSSGDTRWCIGNQDNNNEYYYGYGRVGGNISLPNKIIIISLNFLNDKKFTGTKLDETLINTVYLPTLSFTPQNQIRIFGASGMVASYTKWYGKIYAFQISQGSNIIMDLIPVRVGTTGYMYDKVSKQLFGNAGTGDFILGNDK